MFRTEPRDDLKHVRAVFGNGPDIFSRATEVTNRFSVNDADPALAGWQRHLAGAEAARTMEYHSSRVSSSGVGMNESRVLVVGATGQLGGVIARKLMASGTRVRALARNRDALASLERAAEIAAVDLRDVPRLTDACRGVEQIVATANNNMGKGGPQPIAYRSLRLPEPLRRRAQHRRAAFDLRLVPRRRAGRAGRYLSHQVVHRGCHPPQRRAACHASANRVHGHLDRSDRRQEHSRQRASP